MAMSSTRDRQQRRGLAAARRTAGHTQESLAESLGVDRTTVGRWEHSTGLPHPRIRPKLAAALNVSPEDLAALLSDTANQPQVHICVCRCGASMAAPDLR